MNDAQAGIRWRHRLGGAAYNGGMAWSSWQLQQKNSSCDPNNKKWHDKIKLAEYGTMWDLSCINWPENQNLKLSYFFIRIAINTVFASFLQRLFSIKLKVDGATNVKF